MAAIFVYEAVRVAAPRALICNDWAERGSVSCNFSPLSCDRFHHCTREARDHTEQNYLGHRLTSLLSSRTSYNSLIDFTSYKYKSASSMHSSKACLVSLILRSNTLISAYYSIIHVIDIGHILISKA
jgi:hypothetical protein